MKKLISIFLLIATVFSFFILFNNEKSKQQNNMELAEQQLKYSYKILMPTQLSNLSQNEVYLKIKAAIDKTQGNIYYTRTIGDDQHEIKYVYTTNLQYFSNFKLKNGRSFTKSALDTYSFLSSENTHSSNQIGTIATFAGKNKFEISTLKSMVKQGYLFDGYCTVTFNNNNVNLFISDLEKSFNISGFQIVPNTPMDVTSSPTTILIVIGIYIIVMLLVLYNILKSYKIIGIEKLMGTSNKSIYINRLLILVKIQIIVTIPSSIIMILYFFKDYNQYFCEFLFKLILLDIIQLIALLAICSIPFLYIKRIKVSDMIKNKQPNSEIMIVNFIVKTILLVIFIICINQGISNYNRIKDVFTNSFKQWDDIKNYAVIPNISNISNDQLNSDKFEQDQKNMYLYFNAKGAILANFSEYSPDIRSMRISQTKYEYQRDNVTVNPNYLNKYPIYDENNKRIVIPESDSDYTVLVPNKYKNSEKNIRNMLQIFINGYSEQNIKNENIKIIWTKSNQKVFSMLMDVNPNEGNYVENPIIRVLTDSNGALSDYDTILGIDTNPFKIKVDNYLNPGDTIRPVLQQFGYNKYVKTISNVDEEVASEITDVRQLLQYLSLTLLLSGIAIVIVILQNIYNYFKKYKTYIAIKQLHGYKLIDNHKLFFQILFFKLGYNNYLCNSNQNGKYTNLIRAFSIYYVY